MHLETILIFAMTHSFFFPQKTSGGGYLAYPSVPIPIVTSFVTFWISCERLWPFSGVYLHVTVSAKDMGEGPVLESPIFYPPPCYHSGNNLLYSNSCMVSFGRVQEHSNLLIHYLHSIAYKYMV
jgi:hypothetical protein